MLVIGFGGLSNGAKHGGFQVELGLDHAASEVGIATHFGAESGDVTTRELGSRSARGSGGEHFADVVALLFDQRRLWFAGHGANCVI